MRLTQIRHPQLQREIRRPDSDLTTDANVLPAATFDRVRDNRPPQDEPQLPGGGIMEQR